MVLNFWSSSLYPAKDWDYMHVLPCLALHTHPAHLENSHHITQAGFELASVSKVLKLKACAAMLGSAINFQNKHFYLFLYCFVLEGENAWSVVVPLCIWYTCHQNEGKVPVTCDGSLAGKSRCFTVVLISMYVPWRVPPVPPPSPPTNKERKSVLRRVCIGSTCSEFTWHFLFCQEPSIGLLERENWQPLVRVEGVYPEFLQFLCSRPMDHRQGSLLCFLL